jgi:hypothetical protein
MFHHEIQKNIRFPFRLLLKRIPESTKWFEKHLFKDKDFVINKKIYFTIESQRILALNLIH